VGDWLRKLRLKLLYSVARAIEIKPFLKADPNSYCPCCGHRNGTINAMAADGEVEGSKVFLLHSCKVCNYRFAEASVTKIKHNFMAEASEDSESQAIEIMSKDRRTKNIRTEVVVNGVAAQK
jgi:transposase-like protein